jgi:cytochrome c oxidase cbb3-type subunit 3
MCAIVRDAAVNCNQRKMFALKVFAMASFASALLYGQLPNAPGQDTVKRVCGACHPAELVLSKGMTREGWGAIVSNMISRGAKGTDAEFAQVVDYLSANLPPKTGAGAPGSAKTPKRPMSLIDEAGAADKHEVDDDAAARGAATYTAQCVSCHGPKARGTSKGPDLVRSLVVLGDRYGDKIGPFLKKGHPASSGAAAPDLSQTQMGDLAHFLHQKVGDTLRTGPYTKVLNVLTGDPKAGQAYFNGAGGCAQCHSATGDLAGIGKKYDPPVLQLKTIFPQTVAFGRRSMGAGRKPLTVTVTTASGERVEGVLVQMDDFNVALRDAAGQYRSFARESGVKVEKHNPYAAHEALLDQYTDKDMHDVVAYLETLK